MSKEDFAVEINELKTSEKTKQEQVVDPLKQLISDGLFADKTLLIKKFLQVEGGRRTYILRPFGFGKTTLLDIIEAMYTDMDRLKGTAVYEEGFDESLPVIRIDMSKLIATYPYPIKADLNTRIQSCLEDIKLKSTPKTKDADGFGAALFAAFYDEIVVRNSHSSSMRSTKQSSKQTGKNSTSATDAAAQEAAAAAAALDEAAAHDESFARVLELAKQKTAVTAHDGDAAVEQDGTAVTAQDGAAQARTKASAKAAVAAAAHDGDASEVGNEDDDLIASLEALSSKPASKQKKTSRKSSAADKKKRDAKLRNDAADSATAAALDGASADDSADAAVAVSEEGAVRKGNQYIDVDAVKTAAFEEMDKADSFALNDSVNESFSYIPSQTSERSSLFYVAHLLSRCAKQSRVLLIDNIDAPLLAAINDPQLYNHRTHILTYLFSILGGQKDVFRHIIITGSMASESRAAAVTENGFPYLEVDSKFSYSEDCAKIIGISEHDLISPNFIQPMTNALKIMQHIHRSLNNTVPTSDNSDPESVIASNLNQLFASRSCPGSIYELTRTLNDFYGNYSFNRIHRAMPPISVINFLRYPQYGFYPYRYACAPLDMRQVYEATGQNLTDFLKNLSDVFKGEKRCLLENAVLPSNLRPSNVVDGIRRLQREYFRIHTLIAEILKEKGENHTCDGLVKMRARIDDIKKSLKELKRKLPADKNVSKAIAAKILDEDKNANQVSGNVIFENAEDSIDISADSDSNSLSDNSTAANVSKSRAKGATGAAGAAGADGSKSNANTSKAVSGDDATRISDSDDSAKSINSAKSAYDLIDEFEKYEANANATLKDGKTASSDDNDKSKGEAQSNDGADASQDGDLTNAAKGQSDEISGILTDEIEDAATDLLVLVKRGNNANSGDDSERAMLRRLPVGISIENMMVAMGYLTTCRYDNYELLTTMPSYESFAALRQAVLSSLFSQGNYQQLPDVTDVDALFSQNMKTFLKQLRTIVHSLTFNRSDVVNQHTVTSCLNLYFSMSHLNAATVATGANAPFLADSLNNTAQKASERISKDEAEVQRKLVERLNDKLNAEYDARLNGEVNKHRKRAEADPDYEPKFMAAMSARMTSNTATFMAEAFARKADENEPFDKEELETRRKEAEVAKRILTYLLDAANDPELSAKDVLYKLVKDRNADPSVAELYDGPIEALDPNAFVVEDEDTADASASANEDSSASAAQDGAAKDEASASLSDEEKKLLAKEQEAEALAASFRDVDSLDLPVINEPADPHVKGVKNSYGTTTYSFGESKVEDGTAAPNKANGQEIDLKGLIQNAFDKLKSSTGTVVTKDQEAAVTSFIEKIDTAIKVHKAQVERTDSTALISDSSLSTSANGTAASNGADASTAASSGSAAASTAAADAVASGSDAEATAADSADAAARAHAQASAAASAASAGNADDSARAKSEGEREGNGKGMSLSNAQVSKDIYKLKGRAQKSKPKQDESVAVDHSEQPLPSERSAADAEQEQALESIGDIIASGQAVAKSLTEFERKSKILAETAVSPERFMEILNSQAQVLNDKYGKDIATNVQTAADPSKVGVAVSEDGTAVTDGAVQNGQAASSEPGVVVVDFNQLSNAVQLANEAAAVNENSNVLVTRIRSGLKPQSEHKATTASANGTEATNSNSDDALATKIESKNLSSNAPSGHNALSSSLEESAERVAHNAIEEASTAVAESLAKEAQHPPLYESTSADRAINKAIANIVKAVDSERGAKTSDAQGTDGSSISVSGGNVTHLERMAYGKAESKIPAEPQTLAQRLKAELLKKREAELQRINGGEQDPSGADDNAVAGSTAAAAHSAAAVAAQSAVAAATVGTDASSEATADKAVSEGARTIEVPTKPKDLQEAVQMLKNIAKSLSEKREGEAKDDAVGFANEHEQNKTATKGDAEYEQVVNDTAAALIKDYLAAKRDNAQADDNAASNNGEINDFSNVVALDEEARKSLVTSVSDNPITEDDEAVNGYGNLMICRVRAQRYAALAASSEHAQMQAATENFKAELLSDIDFGSDDSDLESDSKSQEQGDVGASVATTTVTDVNAANAASNTAATASSVNAAAANATDVNAAASTQTDADVAASASGDEGNSANSAQVTTAASAANDSNVADVASATAAAVGGDASTAVADGATADTAAMAAATAATAATATAAHAASAATDGAASSAQATPKSSHGVVPYPTTGDVYKSEKTGEYYIGRAAISVRKSRNIGIRSEFEYHNIEGEVNKEQQEVDAVLARIANADNDQDRLIEDYTPFLSLRRQAIKLHDLCHVDEIKTYEYIRLKDIAESTDQYNTAMFIETLMECDCSEDFINQYNDYSPIEAEMEVFIARINTPSWCGRHDLYSILEDQVELIINSTTIKDKLFRLQTIADIAAHQEYMFLSGQIWNHQQDFKHIALSTRAAVMENAVAAMMGFNEEQTKQAVEQAVSSAQGNNKNQTNASRAQDRADTVSMETVEDFVVADESITKEVTTTADLSNEKDLEAAMAQDDAIAKANENSAKAAMMAEAAAAFSPRNKAKNRRQPQVELQANSVEAHLIKLYESNMFDKLANNASYNFNVVMSSTGPDQVNESFKNTDANDQPLNQLSPTLIKGIALVWYTLKIAKAVGKNITTRQKSFLKDIDREVGLSRIIAKVVEDTFGDADSPKRLMVEDLQSSFKEFSAADLAKATAARAEKNKSSSSNAADNSSQANAADDKSPAADGSVIQEESDKIVSVESDEISRTIAEIRAYADKLPLPLDVVMELVPTFGEHPEVEAAKREILEANVLASEAQREKALLEEDAIPDELKTEAQKRNARKRAELREIRRKFKEMLVETVTQEVKTQSMPKLNPDAELEYLRNLPLSVDKILNVRRFMMLARTYKRRDLFDVAAEILKDALARIDIEQPGVLQERINSVKINALNFSSKPIEHADSSKQEALRNLGSQGLLGQLTVFPSPKGKDVQHSNFTIWNNDTAMIFEIQMVRNLSDAPQALGKAMSLLISVSNPLSEVLGRSSEQVAKYKLRRIAMVALVSDSGIKLVQAVNIDGNELPVKL